MRLVVGVTGATGTVLAARVLTALRTLDVETHLVLSRWGRATLELETDLRAADLHALADRVHGPGDLAAPIASGSYPTDGMIIVPCSMKTLAAVRHGFGDGLVPRAALVTLKERRRLVLCPRELPLSEPDLENMLALTRMGAVLAPPVPAFYHRPRDLDDVLDHLVTRLLDQFGLRVPDGPRWEGPAARVARDASGLSRHAPGIPSAHFRDVMARLPTGVSVVSTPTADGPMLRTAGTVTSVSLDPALVSVCLRRSSPFHDAVAASGLWGVSVLAADQEHLSRRFGATHGDRSTGDVEHVIGLHSGAPLLSGSLATIECRTAAAHVAGDHTLFVGQVLGMQACRDAEPLVFHHGGYAVSRAARRQPAG